MRRRGFRTLPCVLPRLPPRAVTLGHLLRARIDFRHGEVIAVVRQLLSGAAVVVPGPALPPLEAIALDDGAVLRVIEPTETTAAERVKRAAIVLRGLLPDPGSDGDSSDAARLRSLAANVLGANEATRSDEAHALRRAVAAEQAPSWLVTAAALWERWRLEAGESETPSHHVLPERLAEPVSSGESLVVNGGPDVQIIPLYPDEPLPWDGEDTTVQSARTGEQFFASEVELRSAPATSSLPVAAMWPTARHQHNDSVLLEVGPADEELVRDDPARDDDLALNDETDAARAEDRESAARSAGRRSRVMLAAIVGASVAALAMWAGPSWQAGWSASGGPLGGGAMESNGATAGAPPPNTGTVDPHALQPGQLGQDVRDENAAPGEAAATAPRGQAPSPAQGQGGAPGSSSSASLDGNGTAIVAEHPAAAASSASDSTITPTIVAATRPAEAKPLQIGVEPTFSPSFSAAGSELYFHAGGNGESRLMRAVVLDDGRVPEVWRILDDGARNYHPRLSPDGRYVAFDSDRTGTRGVHILDLQRGVAWRASGEGYAAAPAWSPDGRTLALIRAEPGHDRVWNLWALALATGEMRRLTSHDRAQTWSASWFPDGRRICYSHEDRLSLLNLTNGTSRVFASPRPGRLIRTPAVSPDGRFVAFQVRGEGAWLLDLERETTHRLLEDRTAEEFAWSPDGARLAFHSRRDGTWRVWLLSDPT